MAGRIVGKVFERTIGSAPRKAVLTCLAEHSNPDGEMAFPSAARISQETELGESTVRRALAELRASKLIIRTKGSSQHRPATYRINLKALSDLPLVEVYREPDLSLGEPDLSLGEPDLSERDPNRPLTVKNRPPLADGKPPSARDVQNAIREELEEAFHQATRIPRPKATTEKQRREAGEMWWVPLRQIAEAYEWDVAQARAAINRAVKEMRASKPVPLTIGSPKSILKVVMSGLGQNVNSTDEWLAAAGLPPRRQDA